VAARQLQSTLATESVRVDLRGKERQIALEILAYLARHPDAKDSLRGIRSWWLGRPDKWSEDDVRRTAAALVEGGALQSWEASPGLMVFGPSREFLQYPGRFVHQFGLDRKHEK